MHILVKNTADVDGQIRSTRMLKFLAVAFNLMRERYEIQAGTVQDYGYIIHYQPNTFLRICNFTLSMPFFFAHRAVGNLNEQSFAFLHALLTFRKGIN